MITISGNPWIVCIAEPAEPDEAKQVIKYYYVFSAINSVTNQSIVVGFSTRSYISLMGNFIEEASEMEIVDIIVAPKILFQKVAKYKYSGPAIFRGTVSSIESQMVELTKKLFEYGIRVDYLTHWGLTTNEITLIDEGNILMAVKEVKYRTGLCLKESKEIVDNYRMPASRALKGNY